MGSAVLEAAVPYLGKVTWISLKGQWSTKKNFFFLKSHAGKKLINKTFFFLYDIFPLRVSIAYFLSKTKRTQGNVNLAP